MQEPKDISVQAGKHSDALVSDGADYTPISVLGVDLPGPISRDLQRFSAEASMIRNAALRHTPAVIVNHSTNVIGGVQLLAEMCMMLASVKPANKEELKTPFKTIGKSLKNALNSAFGRGVSKVVDGKTLYQSNPWSARSTLTGMSLMALAAFTPDKKDTEENIDAMAKLAAESTAGYGFKRLVQSVSIWDGRYKRQHVGLGLMTSGVFSTIAGLNNVDYDSGARVFNKAHSIGGVISAIAGGQLLFSLTNEQGWARFGSTMWLRLFSVPSAIGRKIEKGDNWQMYTLGQVGLQGTNTISALIGGAEKREDGTIVDQKSVGLAAKKKYRKIKEEGASSRDEGADEIAPSVTVSEIKDVAPAMPEQRREAELAKKETVQVA